MDVFAFGIILYELLSLKVPFYNISNGIQRNREVINKHRPLPQAKETRSLVLLQELMKMCWSHSAEERPRMEQVHKWASYDEFERLRAEINMKDVASISCACITRITPDNENESITEMEKHLVHFQTVKNSCYSSDTMDRVDNSDDTTGLATGQSGSILASVSEDSSHIKPEQSGSSSKGEIRFQSLSFSPDPEVSCDEAKQQLQSYTQIWLCSSRKGLLEIFTYYDGHPGAYVCCTMGTL